MTVTTHEPDPDDAADDDLAAERAGQSATAEEAMDAVKEEGASLTSRPTPPVRWISRMSTAHKTPPLPPHRRNERTT
jgi:hypothetical protein